MRQALTVVGTAAVLALAVAREPNPRPAYAIPTVLGVLVLAGLIGTWPIGRRWIAGATGLVTAATLVGAGAWFARPTAGGGIWSLLLTAVLMVLLALLCRWVPPIQAATIGPAAVLAESTLVLLTTGAPVLRGWEAVGACVFWSLAGLVGAGAGVYLRLLDGRRAAAVRDARRAQRVRLAADLHDHVAHDVSAMVLQAQAARVLLGDRAGEVGAVLDRIETDGARALESMQRSIQVLREQEQEREVEPEPMSLRELRTRHPDARFEIGDGLEDVGPVLRRVVAEALTNVAKHAPGSAVVRLGRAQGDIVLTVTNPLPGTAGPDAPGLRYGLQGLADQVHAAGGTFTAGPVGDHWEVRAELP
ncbi:sensor histidine kinase [Cryptosporangium minutisporangium]|uniref:histidine kinase n=1 Tax=Cryptosporangium minutisporangium TaxID=113569 RepID=A0ABP6SYX0_9ACTN